MPRLPVIQPVDTSNGVDRYDISITEFKQQLHSDLPQTSLRGYHNTFPGPTIEALRGKQVQVNWMNKLSGSSTLLGSTDTFPSGMSRTRIITHLHGANTSAESDGNPSNAVGPGQIFTALYDNNQPPATLWYHDHSMGISRTNVYLGLSGLYIVRASANESTEMNLPTNEFEIPIIIQDRSFMPDGQLSYPDKWVMEFLGDAMLANGKVWPYLEVQPTKYRLRLLNGCNSRVLNLRFTNTSLGFVVIGNDNGYMSAAASVSSIRLSPSERVDVIVDFCGHLGEDIVVTNDAINPMTGSTSINPCTTGRILQFQVRASSIPTPACSGINVKFPTEVRSVLSARPENSVMTRDIILMTDASTTTMPPHGGMPGMSRAAMQGTHMVGIPKLGVREKNGKPKPLGFSSAATEIITPGSIEVWRLINLSDDIHPIHIHVSSLRILDRQVFDVDTLTSSGALKFMGDPIPPEPFEAGPKDTVRVDNRTITRILVQFDNRVGRYVWHCHILEHEENDMMRPLLMGISSASSQFVARFWLVQVFAVVVLSFMQ